MTLKKVKKRLLEIYRIANDYELKKMKIKREIKDSTERIKKLTEDIKNTPIT